MQWTRREINDLPNNYKMVTKWLKRAGSELQAQQPVLAQI